MASHFKEQRAHGLSFQRTESAWPLISKNRECMASHFKEQRAHGLSFQRTESAWPLISKNSPGQCRIEQDGAEAPLTLTNYLNWKLGLEREILLAQAVQP
jgi:hypothetical protein